MNMQDISNKMDESVRALRDAFIHENQEMILLQTAASLVEKLEQRDRRIQELEHLVAFLESKLHSFTQEEESE